jgi:hypothetical protein
MHLVRVSQSRLLGTVWSSLDLTSSRRVRSCFGLYLHTGQVQHLETMMVSIGGIGHLILIFACLTALFNQTTVTKKWWRFLAGGVLVLGYFAVIVAIARPR